MKTFRFLLTLLIGLVLLAHRSLAAATQLEWYGHSAFKLTTPSGHVLLIDPWITNPKNPTGKADVAALTHVDFILITHGHFDHVGDAVEIARKTGAKLVCTADLGTALVDYARFPKAQAGMDTQGNFGGEITLLGGEVKVTFIPAIHSSAIQYEQMELVPITLRMSASGKGTTFPTTVKTEHQAFAGNPSGFLITVRGGPTIYHTGDTDLFLDMALIPQLHKVDVMLCCIGGHFTMGPDRAAQAVALVKPTVVIPIHYGTFPILNGTPAQFGAALKKKGVKTHLTVMRVHQVLMF